MAKAKNYQTITINGSVMKILDTLEYITLADSFVLNKIGRGHGEAKLYVGNESKRLFDFFSDFENECFFRKSDLLLYLEWTKDEFNNPQQEYNNKSRMPQRYAEMGQKVNNLKSESINFLLNRVNVEPPRVYARSHAEIFRIMRQLGLPNLSYLSIMKIQDDNGKIYLYFKMFIDYNPEIVKYVFPTVKAEIEKIERDENITTTTRSTLIDARIGQGDYRRKLLIECSVCPFTHVNDERLLIASHIKPWVASTDEEKLDPKNGIICTPTFDRLFDQGFISISDNNTLLVSPWISQMNQKRLRIRAC